MTPLRSAAYVLASQVVFELECIDRVYCNLYVRPKADGVDRSAWVFRVLTAFHRHLNRRGI